ncbi:MAG: porin family protein [Phycisphaerales bacterium]|nr:porin family protein [Hyphomonadaceae bacterium]
MKNRLLNFAALIGALSVSGPAAADTGWYAALDVGRHWPGEMTMNPVGDDIDIGLEGDWSAFVRAGRGLGDNWRVEAELAQRPGDYSTTYLKFDHGDFIEVEESGNLDALSIMGNVIYDIAPESSVSPFVGLGVGAVMFEEDYEENNAFAWQGLAGVSWRLTARISADFTYRYFAAELDSTLGNGQVYEDQAFTVGARYRF